MKAVLCTKYGPPEVLQLKELEKPTPREYEILVKVRATTVTVADHRIRSFNIPASARLPTRFVLGLRKPRKQVLGTELAGVVEAVGKKVRLFKKGDQVFAATLNNFSAYADYTCLPENGPIALMPVNSSYEEAAALPIGARTALHYLRRGKLKKGQKVLVYGASGSVGTYAVQLAKHFGAEVTGVCSKANLELVKSLGADKVVNYADENFHEQLERYDIILLAVDKWAFSLCKHYLNPEGVYMNVTEPLMNFEQLWTSLASKKKIIMGENPTGSADTLIYLKELVEAGVLKPVIDRCYSLEEIVEAHRYVDKGHKKGNVVIRVKDA